LPNAPNPIFFANPNAKILICGQAPGVKAHESGILWNDRSGMRLREWLDLSPEKFYNNPLVAIVPMGFCYPGKAKSGDLPPRKECTELWFDKLLKQLPDVELMILVGTYAQDYFLEDKGKNMAETVKNYRKYLPLYLPIPHPSPRNIKWFKDNPWFEAEVLPYAKKRVKELVG
jgi:uracil-DNA glycosylase